MQTQGEVNIVQSETGALQCKAVSTGQVSGQSAQSGQSQKQRNTTQNCWNAVTGE